MCICLHLKVKRSSTLHICFGVRVPYGHVGGIPPLLPNITCRLNKYRESYKIQLRVILPIIPTKYNCVSFCQIFPQNTTACHFAKYRVFGGQSDSLTLRHYLLASQEGASDGRNSDTPSLISYFSPPGHVIFTDIVSLSTLSNVLPMPTVKGTYRKKEGIGFCVAFNSLGHIAMR